MGDDILKFFKFLIVLLTLSMSANATTINVPSDYPTISMAVDSSLDGDTILVSPGTYSENLNFRGKSFHIISTNGPEVTSVQPFNSNLSIIRSVNGQYPTYQSFSTIKGFTFTGFLSTESMIYLWGTSIEFSENIVRDNYTSSQRGWIMELVSTESQIHHNLFIDNEAVCVVIDGDVGVDVYNNTFYNIYKGVSKGTVKHNIFVNSTIAAIAATTPQSGYNNFYQETGTIFTYGPNSYYLDPLFIDAAGHDFHLQHNSPMINAGDPDPIYTELDNTVMDLGRFNAVDSLLPLAQSLNFSPVKDTTMVTSLTPTFHWTYYDTLPASQNGVQIQIGNDSDWTVAEVWNSGLINTSNSSAVYTGTPLNDRQLYYIRIRAHNSLGYGNWKDTTFFTNIATRVFTYPSQFANIQDAFDTALDDDTILVLPGTYNENIEFAGKRINLVSSGGAEVTTFHANITGKPVVTLNDSPLGGRSSIHGFTLENGTKGISVNNGSFSLSDNIIQQNANNSSAQGSGIHTKYTSNGYIENNIIRNNQTPFFGAAIYIEDSYGDSVRYNLIHDNSGDPQVRVLRTDSLMFYNNTIDIGTGSGFFGIVGNTQMYNNIFINGSSTAVLTGGTPSHQITGGYNLFFNNNSDLSGTINLNNTLTSNPLFVDTATNNYNLLATSPCINSGNPNSFFNDPDGSRNDRGALPFDTLASIYFELIYPPNVFEEIVYDMKPTFIWSSSIDGDINDVVTYNFYIDDSFPFTSPTLISGLSDTTLVLTDSLLFSTRYYWKVVAEDGNGFENETSVKDFWTWSLGDINHDHSVDISDMVSFIDFMFNGGPAISPLLLGDFNGNCAVDISDVVIFVDFMFANNGTQLGIGCQ